MEADDADLTKAMDEEVARLLPTTQHLVTDFRTTFGSADTILTQQWISHGLTQHTDQVTTTVQSAQDFTEDEEMEVLAEGRAGEATYVSYETNEDYQDYQEYDDDSEESEAAVDSRLTVKDLPKGTRVVLVNHNDSFFGAVGTVIREVGRGRVRVEFDLKQGVRYTIPAKHLDLHHDNKDDTEALLTTEGGRWTFNGVPSLVEFLRANEGKHGKWAFTGSVALSYWAREFGEEFRSPHDMDIVVDNLNGWWYDLGMAVKGKPGEPSLKADHKTIHLNMGKLDILKNGAGLGEFGRGPYEVGGVNVVSLRTIGAYKKRRGEDKDIEDLKVVDKLMRLQQERESK